MFAYASLSRSPNAFRSLTGLTPADFERLRTDFPAAPPRRRAPSRTTRPGQPRQRGAGAGHPHRQDDRPRLRRARVWLRVYPTYALLGCCCGLHTRNAQRNVRDVLATREPLDAFPVDHPGRDRPQLPAAAEVRAAFPPVRVVIDSKEQRVNRPPGDAAQKPYYSGKKQTHTVKTQGGVDPCGRIEAVGSSVPGGAHPALTLRRGSGVWEPLARGAAALLDKG